MTEIENRVGDIEKEIALLRERNRRVEAEKAWETSWARRLSIATATYVVAVIALDVVGVANPALAAFVPTIGYILSTLTLPALRRWWLEENLH